MTQFEARTSTEPDRVVVTLAGDCDLAVRDELASVLLAAVDSAPVVVVDAGALEFLDSSGVHGLISAHHAARARHGRLYLVNAGGMVADVLEITGVGALLSPSTDGGDSSHG